MSYSFTPLNKDELDAIDLIDEGQYSFEVLKSTRKTSKAGNPMAELQLKVWDMKGRERTVFDFLVFSTVPLNMRKVKHFCSTIGKPEWYENGTVPEELEGNTGKAHIGIQEPQPKSDGGHYPKKNYVIDYLTVNNVSTSLPKDEPFIDDDLPF